MDFSKLLEGYTPQVYYIVLSIVLLIGVLVVYYLYNKSE